MSAPLPPISFLQARDWHAGPRSKIDLIVIHTAEVAPTPSSAEALMRACHRGGLNADGSKRLASWHFAVDSDSITQSVRETDIAFHAPGANNNGLGIELATRAVSAAWGDAYHLAMLDLAARLVAKLCTTWKIPAKFVDADHIVAGSSGITRHLDVTNAFKRSTHTDPGPAFPLSKFLDMVDDALPTQTRKITP